MSKLVKSITLIGASTVFALLVAELALQVIPGALPVDVQQAFSNKGVPHPEIGNLPEPYSTGTIVTADFEAPFDLDQHGFRNDGDWPGQTDIVAIGDSLVFGYGVARSEAWPQLLAERIGSSVLNLGLVGASPQQYRQVYETFGRSMNPGIVIVGFFARNDFWDAHKYAAWEESGAGGNYLVWRGFGQPTAEQYANPVYRAFFELRKRSYLLALMKAGKDALFRSRSGKPASAVAPDGTPMYVFPEDYREKTMFSRPGNPTFEIVVEQLRQIRDAAVSDGSRLIVLLQPAKEDVYGPAGEPLPDSSAGLREALDEMGIEYIDSAPALRRLATDGPPLYFSLDGHPNAEGYRVLAELLADYLGQSASRSKESTSIRREILK